MLAVALGDKETSLSLLAKAVEDREPELIWAKADPRLDVTRGTPGSSPSSTEYFQGFEAGPVCIRSERESIMG